MKKVTERPTMTLSSCRSVIPVHFSPGSRISHPSIGSGFRAKSRNKLKAKAGFTLIELMVASSIFIIVMVVAIGAVLSIVDANRKAQSLNAVMTNLNLALESMTRDLREGSNYCPPGNCTSTSITFTDSQDDTVTYQFVSGSGATGGKITKQVDNGTTAYTSAVTAPEVNIQKVTFAPQPYSAGNQRQSIIQLDIQGVAGVNTKTQSNFNIETLVTKRLLD